MRGCAYFFSAVNHLINTLTNYLIKLWKKESQDV